MNGKDELLQELKKQNVLLTKILIMQSELSGHLLALRFGQQQERVCHHDPNNPKVSR